MFAIYGEQFGSMILEEDNFSSKEEALEWLKANKTGVNALGNWEIRKVTTMTVLSKSYPASGRPESIKVVPSANKEEIDRLILAGYKIEKSGKPTNYTVSDAWNELTGDGKLSPGA